MPARHADIARETIEAWARGDIEWALSRTAPDIVAVRAEPDAQTYRGREGVVRMYEDWTASFERFEMEVGEVLEVGERVVVQVSQRGTGKASGVPVEGDFWFVYTFAGEEITHLESYATRAAGLAAAGAADVAQDDRQGDQ